MTMLKTARIFREDFGGFVALSREGIAFLLPLRAEAGFAARGLGERDGVERDCGARAGGELEDEAREFFLGGMNEIHH